MCSVTITFAYSLNYIHVYIVHNDYDIRTNNVHDIDAVVNQ